MLEKPDRQLEMSVLQLGVDAMSAAHAAADPGVLLSAHQLAGMAIGQALHGMCLSRGLLRTRNILEAQALMNALGNARTALKKTGHDDPDDELLGVALPFACRIAIDDLLAF
jgi:hypothetical protein